MRTGKMSAADRAAGVREDLAHGWYSYKEICLRRGVSSATVWKIKKGDQRATVGGAR